ncbi:hypothetical protein [Methylobacillus glycogenes]|uniref:hypothetical protein n=1 Tax=Methylobacillus glycogenes TaxID=406 RepID=UPI0019022FBE|nr:hypothetical protein [Methylobacillus glycogenes]
MARMWMVRGEGGSLYDAFRERNIAAIGWSPLADIESQALERIKDKVSELELDDMQQLLAGILRAMGYKIQVIQTL